MSCATNYTKCASCRSHTNELYKSYVFCAHSAIKLRKDSYSQVLVRQNSIETVTYPVCYWRECRNHWHANKPRSSWSHRRIRQSWTSWREKVTNPRWRVYTTIAMNTSVGLAVLFCICILSTTSGSTGLRSQQLRFRAANEGVPGMLCDSYTDDTCETCSGRG